jgi:hypothetical protein
MQKNRKNARNAAFPSIAGQKKLLLLRLFARLPRIVSALLNM